VTLALHIEAERLALNAPFRISRGVKTHAEVVVVELQDGEVSGRGECVPYPRYGETLESVSAQLRRAATRLADREAATAVVAGLPAAIMQTLELARQGVLSWGIILVLVLVMLGVVAAIVFIERAQRRLLVQYPKRQMGNRMFQGDASHLPLKLNASGVIPPIFASSLLMLPGAVAGFSHGGPEWLSGILAALGQRQPVWYVVYVALIVFFAFFYTSIVLNPQETADNLRKYGGFLPGIRPGAKTAEYIDYVLTRITVVGALYLAAVCVLPEMLQSSAHVSFYFGGTSLLIAVSVTMDTVAQIQSHLLAHQYEGLIKKAKLRGATRRI